LSNTENIHKVMSALTAVDKYVLYVLFLEWGIDGSWVDRKLPPITGTITIILNNDYRWIILFKINVENSCFTSSEVEKGRLHKKDPHCRNGLKFEYFGYLVTTRIMNQETRWDRVMKKKISWWCPFTDGQSRLSNCGKGRGPGIQALTFSGILVTEKNFQ
jgi:hypothetical protein